MKDKKIIGLVGLIGSGKGTVGDILRMEYGFKTISYAEALKDCLSIIFDWPRDMIEGDTTQSREWRETIDPWWSKELSIPDFTCRKAMQMIGTDAIRSVVSENIWASVVHRKILRSTCDKWVITDCRFPNEISLVKQLGGDIWRIKRGDEPLWYETAYMQKKQILPRDIDNTMEIKYPHIHRSEWSWVGEPIDYVIENNSTLDELREQIKCRIAS